MSEPRFYVVELEGYMIRPAATQAGNARLLLTASVLDRAYCHREVARFAEPSGTVSGERFSRSKAGKRGWVREQAVAEAARLNAWDASA